MQRLRSAHAFLQSDRRTVVVSQNWRVITSETDGARVVLAGARFRKAEPQPLLDGVLAAFGGEAK